MSKEETRRREALRKQKRTKALKGAVVGSAVVVLPLLAYLISQS